ncbi:MAG TPA: hypothetical protein ENN72_01170 [Firmicutes bacterium]|nr:hypothetical protein [Bacillota bacterium]
MKKIVLFLMIFGATAVSAARSHDISVLSFPYSVRALAAGHTFDPQGRTFTGNPFGSEMNYATFSSSFLPEGIHVHYFSLSYGNFITDLISYHWGSIEGRDEWGNLTGEYRAYDTAVSAGYRREWGAFRLFGSLRYLGRVAGPERTNFLIPSLSAGWAENGLCGGASLNMMDGKKRFNLYGGGFRGDFGATLRWESVPAGSSFHGGLSWKAAEFFTLMSGWNDGAWTAGMALSSTPFILEYALQLNDGDLMANLFSLSYEF